MAENGFEYEGQRYHSLTVIAERITGAHWSGPRFFGVTKRARGSLLVAICQNGKLVMQLSLMQFG